MPNNQLSKAPYKGTKDVYPEDIIARNYLFDTWKKVAKSFGYEEYDTSIIEEAKLYEVKSGDEIANKQLYRFTDKGDREIALRPEMTPSLARIVVNKKNSLIFPLKLFNIGRFFRYEKPQKGRSREFFQLNFDVIGVSSIEAELEILQFAVAVMDELGAPKDSYEIKINSRYLLEYVFDQILNLEKEKREEVAKMIDNYLKMEEIDFKQALDEILNKEQSEKLLEYLKWSLEDLEKIGEQSKGAKEILDLFKRVKELELENVVFAPNVIRGLQYYTGIVFEMFEKNNPKNTRALLGGGRYDTLLEIFDENKIPAVGLGWGDVTMTEFLENQNLLPKQKTDIDVFVTLMDPSLYKESVKVANQFRDAGKNTLMQLEPSKLSKQLKFASKKEVPWVVILGEEEIKKKKIVLKDMQASKQKTVSFKKALKIIK